MTVTGDVPPDGERESLGDAARGRTLSADERGALELRDARPVNSRGPTSPSFPSRLPKLFGRNWVAVVACSLMVASEYKLRHRPVGVALQGRADSTILIEVLVYVAAGTFLAVNFGPSVRGRRPMPLLVLMWGFGLTLAFSALYAQHRTFAVVRGYELLVGCALGHAIARHASRDMLHRFAHAYVLLVSASVVVGLAHPFPRERLQAHRFNWLYVHPVVAGTYLGLAVVLLVAYLAIKSGRGPAAFRRSWYWGLLALNVGALLGTQTRGAIGGCFIGCFVTLLVAARRRRRLDILVVGAVLVALGVVLFGSEVIRYLQRGETAESLATLNSRTTLWSEAFAYLRQRPIFGYGLTASRSLFLDTLGLGGAHNGFVNVITDAGIVGAAWWLGLLGTLGVSLRNLARERRVAIDSALLAGVLAFLVVDSLTTEGLGTPANSAITWLFVVTGWVAVLQSRRSA